MHTFKQNVFVLEGPFLVWEKDEGGVVFLILWIGIAEFEGLGGDYLSFLSFFVCDVFAGLTEMFWFLQVIQRTPIGKQNRNSHNNTDFQRSEFGKL